MTIRGMGSAALMFQSIANDIEGQAAVTEAETHDKRLDKIDERVKLQNKGLRSIFSKIGGALKNLAKGDLKGFWEEAKTLVAPLLKALGTGLLLAASLVAGLFTGGVATAVLIGMVVAGGGALFGSRAVENKQARDDADEQAELQKDDANLAALQNQASDMMQLSTTYNFYVFLDDDREG